MANDTTRSIRAEAHPASAPADLRPDGRRGSASRRKPKAAAASPASPARSRSAASTSTSRPSRCSNRGNGKGGGIAAVRPGARAAGRLARGARRRTTSSRSPCSIPTADGEVEKAVRRCPTSTSTLSRGMLATVDDYRDVPRPGGPAAGRAPLLRPRQAGRARRVSPRRTGSAGSRPRAKLEDEFVCQNSLRAQRRSSTPRWATSGPSCSRTRGT